MALNESIYLNSSFIDANQKNLNKIKSTHLIIDLAFQLCTHTTMTHEKQEKRLKSFIHYYYDKKELHQEKLFEKLFLHCVRLNQFSLVKYLLESPYLDKHIKINTCLNDRDLYPTAELQLFQKISKTNVNALSLAISVKNNDMFDYILEKIDLKKTLHLIPIETLAQQFLRHLESRVFDNNHKLLKFTTKLNCEEYKHYLNEFNQKFKDLVEFYDLKDYVDILYKKKNPKNYDSMYQFPDLLISLTEKSRLEHAVSFQNETTQDLKNKVAKKIKI